MELFSVDTASDAIFRDQPHWVRWAHRRGPRGARPHHSWQGPPPDMTCPLWARPPAPARLVRGATQRGRRMTHVLDGVALGVLMEIVARVAERTLLSMAKRPSPDAAARDQASFAQSEAR